MGALGFFACKKHLTAPEIQNFLSLLRKSFQFKENSTVTGVNMLLKRKDCAAKDTICPIIAACFDRMT